MDGYEVLISAGSNDPASGDFQSVFEAAEMLYSLDGDDTSLDVNNYQFSDGYIHADGYTLDDYYDLDVVVVDNIPIQFYRGRFEPHTLSLADYAGQTIYIAFNHNSHDDFMLQIDDIAITNTISSIPGEPDHLSRFEVLPNPIQDRGLIQIETSRAEDATLRLQDSQGKMIWERSSRIQGKMSIELQAGKIPTGVYQLSLILHDGIATRKLIVN